MLRQIPSLAEIERTHILNTLSACDNNRTQTAKVLGLSLRGLRIKLHEYANSGVAVPPPTLGISPGKDS